MDDIDDIPLPWFTMPDRDDEAAVERWFADVEAANAAAGDEFAATVKACDELLDNCEGLLGVRLRARIPAC